MSENPLDDIKPGDEVAVITGYGRAYSVARVERVTATQVIVGARRYRTKTGRELGAEGYNFASIDARPQTIAVARREDMKRRLSGISAELNQFSITAARATLDRAEAFLRSVEEWKDAP